jgi:hypothetical protein
LPLPADAPIDTLEYLSGNLIDTKTVDRNNLLSHAVSYTYNALNRT